MATRIRHEERTNAHPEEVVVPDTVPAGWSTDRPARTGETGVDRWRYARTPVVVAAEALAAVALAITAYLHVAGMSEKFSETPYIGVGYVLLSAACVLSIALIAFRDRRGWYLGGLTCLATFIGYVLTRTVGLPAATDDIGNWRETAGIWSLIAEGTMVVLTAIVLAGPLRRRRTA